MAAMPQQNAKNGTKTFGLLTPHARGYRSNDSGIPDASSGSLAKSENARPRPATAPPATSRRYPRRASRQMRTHPPLVGAAKSSHVRAKVSFALSFRSSILWSPRTRGTSGGAASAAAWNSLSRTRRASEPGGWNCSVFAHREGHVSRTIAARSSEAPRVATVEDASSIEAGL